jgi:drug/metabolite transporter (DMT)-like permease
VKETRFLPYAAGIIYAIIFGFSFLFTKLGLVYMSEMQLIAFRFLVAVLALEVLKILKIINPKFKGKNMKFVLVTAIFQPVLYFFFEVKGVNLSMSSEAGLMMSLIPVLTAVFASIFLKEKLKALQVFFILLSVGGVVFINVMKEDLAGSGNLLGIFYLSLAILAGTMYGLFSKKSSGEFKPIEITYIMMWFGAIAFNAIAIIESLLKGDLLNYFKPLQNIEALLPILYLGLLSSVIAFFFMNYSISRIPVSQSAVFTNLVTIFAILAGVFILDEPFGLKDFVGSVMILVGVFGTLYFREKKKDNAQITDHNAQLKD